MKSDRRLYLPYKIYGNKNPNQETQEIIEVGYIMPSLIANPKRTDHQENVL